MPTPPTDLSSRNPGAGRKFASLDPRKPRIDSIINAQPQASSNSSAFDPSSPASVDFNFPFAGSPHGSSNSGIDAPPELRMGRGRPDRTSASEASRGVVPKMSQQHRASMTSIDSAFDQDTAGFSMPGDWTAHAQHRTTSNPDDRHQDTTDVDHDAGSDDDKPAWSDLKTKAGKERKRLPLACIACRRKKIKCSGEKPACKHCVRARVPCVYKVTTRKAAPRTDYNAMLDKRLKRMEDRVIKAIPKEELPDMATTGRANVKPPLPGVQNVKKEKGSDDANKKRSAEDAFAAELSSWKSPNKSKSAVPDPSTGLRRQRDGENKLFIEGNDSLPAQHIQEHLAEVFFDCVYGQSYLLLHKPSFMRKLKAGTVPPVLILALCAVSARFSNHPHLKTEPAFLRGEQWATPARKIIERRHYEPNITILIAMLMLGLHHFGTCEGGLSWSFGGQASRMAYALQLHRELEREPLGREQIAGKSQSNAQAAVPPQPGRPPELSFTDREIRRRTMWACYLMDTFNSSGTERPSLLHEDYFQIQLPIRESHFHNEIRGPTENLDGDTPLQPMSRPTTAPDSAIPAGNEQAELQAEAKSNMGVAAYVVRSVVLWKRIVRYLNLGGKEKDPHAMWDPLSQFTALGRQITVLKDSLPEELTYSQENIAAHASIRLANQFLLLHILLSQCSLFLYRFSIPTYPSTRPHHAQLLSSGMPKSFLTSSAQIVIEAAAQISTIVADAAEHTLTVPFAGYCAYASATVHVWGIFSRSPQLEASSKENLRHNYKYLARMKRYWGMFHYMGESIKDTYRAFADAASKQSSLHPQSMSAGGSNGRGSTSPFEISRSNTPNHTPGHSSGSTANSKQMFQYGDWFDKYPHGVSESEWEKSRLEYRNESEGSSEAVMSARSELQSVEEFFASLNPPSKAEEQQGGGRNKKIPRRRGKSVADGGEKKSTTSQQQQTQRASVSNASARRPSMQQQQQQQSDDLDIPAFPDQLSTTDPFDLTSISPTAYRNQTSHVAGTDPFSANTTNNTTFSPQQVNPYQQFNYSATFPQHPLSNLDRQMVFGAYAGIDPSSISAAGAGMSSADFGWDAMGDINTFPGAGGFGDATGMANTAGGGTGQEWQMSGGMGGGAGGLGSTAFFMPFNMEPPNFGELGAGQLDGMDFGYSPAGLSDLGVGGGGRVGSGSAQGGTGGMGGGGGGGGGPEGGRGSFSGPQGGG